MVESKFKVTGMPRASYLEDASEVELEFSTDEQRRITLRFTPEALESFASRAMQLLIHVQSQKLSIGDHLAIQAVDVVAAAAEAAVGGGKVILAVRGSNGIPQHFSLLPQEAENLRPQLYRAAKSAKAQNARSRH